MAHDSASHDEHHQGIGHVAELPVAWREPLPDVWFWNGDAFEPLDPTRTRLSAREGEFGPEVGFARGLRAAGRTAPVYLVKFNRSGQGLHAGWDGGRWAGPGSGPGRATFHPGDTPEDPDVGLHYRAWLEQVRAATADLSTQGLTPVLRGVVWMQGEQDSKQELAAQGYATNLRRLRARLGADLGAPALPWVYGQVLPHEPALPRFSNRTELRASMAALDARSAAPDATPGMWMVPTEGMPLLADTVHYDAIGQQRLGLAFAAAMVELQLR